MNTLDPNAVAVHNGEFFGLETSLEKAEIVVIPISWDVTTSYRAGTSRGPEAVLEASYQLDLYSPDVPEAWNLPLATLKPNVDWLSLSRELRQDTEKYIQFLAEGGVLEDSVKFQSLLKKVNEESERLNQWLYQTAKAQLQAGKRVLTLGGDHSVPLGAIKAYAEKYSDLSVLHIDAHADLRVAYEGFAHSHASIMDNALNLTSLNKLVQVGIRDCSSSEVEKINSDSRIKTFFDWDLKDELCSGVSWAQLCQKILGELSDKVYISFDIDGLNPQLCPNTGTPVPGGLDYSQIQYLFRALRKSGKQIVGCDLVEVAPSSNEEDQWDGNVGARMMFQMANLIWGKS